MYSYGRNNPLRFVDPTGRLVELPQDEKEREGILAALKAGVGEKAAGYIGVAQKKGHYYVSVSDSKAFAGVNAVSAKLGGIIGDQKRTATVRFESPGTKIAGEAIGAADRGMSPAKTVTMYDLANVHITSGSLGILPPQLLEGGGRRTLTLAEVLVHELGHVDSDWYHSVAESNGVAVRIENQVRELERVPLRIGHDSPFDVLYRSSPIGY